MATESKLIQTSKFLKNVLIFFVVVTIALLVMPMVTESIKNFLQKPKPPETYVYNPYKPTEPIWDEIPEMKMQTKVRISQDTSPIFSSTSEFKKFPEKVYIYKTKPFKETFLTVQNAQNLAQSLGFEKNYKTRPDGTLLWTDENGRTLEFEKSNQLYRLKTDLNFLKNNLDSMASLEDINQTLSQLTENLRKLNINIDSFNLQNPDIATTQDYITRIRIREKLPLAAYFETDQTARKTITEQNIPEYADIYFENPFFSTLEITILGSQINLTNWTSLYYQATTFEEKMGIYEIVSAEEGFERIQSGLGHLAYISTDSTIEESESNLEVIEFRINSELCELVYLITQSGEYTYPVYIFRGTAILEDNSQAEFIIYSPGLK
jgi:hypothetical protein